MDKIIEKKKGWRSAFTKKAMPYWLGAIVVVFVLYLVFRDNSKTLRVDKDTITVSQVTDGQFNDYIRVSGQVQPMVTIQISPLEGGTVQKIIVEEGSTVKAGEPILVLSNDNLDLQILNAEAELAEKENILRNTMISMEQQKLSHEQNRLRYASEARRNKRAFEQNQQLYKEKLISKEDYSNANKTSKYEGGSSIQIDFDRTFGKKGIFRYRTTLFSFMGWMSNLNMKNRYTSVSAYEKALQAWDDAQGIGDKPMLQIHPTVRWENTIDIKATKYLSTTFNFQLYYNRAQNYDIQTQLLLSVGLTYTFKNK